MAQFCNRGTYFALFDAAIVVVAATVADSVVAHAVVAGELGVVGVGVVVLDDFVALALVCILLALVYFLLWCPSFCPHLDELRSVSRCLFGPLVHGPHLFSG